MTRVLIWIIGGGAGILIAFSLYVRLVPMDPNQWHVDPIGVQRSGKPNDYLISEGGDQPAVVVSTGVAETAAAAFEAIRELPRTTLLAGSVEGGWFTVVSRSRLMGYPDATTVRIEPRETGSAVHVYARARYGYSDLGKNSERVALFLKALEQMLDR